MRVLVVTNMYPTDAAPGSGIFVKRQVEALREQHPDWHIEVVHVDTVASTGRYFTGMLEVRRRFREFKPDVVHVHYGLSLVLVSLVRAPIVCTFHGSDLNVGWQRWIAWLLRRKISRSVVVSARLADRVPWRERASIVPCGVDVVRLPVSSHAAARARFGYQAGDVVLGFPGSPTKTVKRYDRFVAVAEMIPASTELRFTGMGSADVLDGLAALDCLVMTSDAEGSPVLTKEALCMGARVVSTDVGDMRQQLSGFTGCRVVAEADAGLLAEAVLASLEEPRPDHEQARRRFDTRVEASAVADLYREVLS